jgi:hypothetical protein
MATVVVVSSLAGLDLRAQNDRTQMRKLAGLSYVNH